MAEPRQRERSPSPSSAAGGVGRSIRSQREPEELAGQLVEAEQLARYRWAGHLAKGCRTLDAGCAIGFGTTILAEAGAREVTGVDAS